MQQTELTNPLRRSMVFAMSKGESQDQFDGMGRFEALGYIIGSFIGLLRLIMPFRLWLVAGASFPLAYKIYGAESNQEIAAAVVFFLAFAFVMIGSLVFSDDRNRTTHSHR